MFMLSIMKPFYRVVANPGNLFWGPTPKMTKKNAAATPSPLPTTGLQRDQKIEN